MKNSRSIGRVCVLASVIGLTGLAGNAFAQDGRGGRPQGDRPAQRDGGRDFGNARGAGGLFGGTQDQIQESDVDLMISLLKLDEPQQELARQLFEDLREQRAQVMAELREQMQDLRGEGGRPDPEAMERFRAVAKEAREKAAEMEKLFYEDVQLVLTPEQREQWTSFEKSRDRSRALRGVGGAVDVGRVFQSFVEKHGAGLDQDALAGAQALAERFGSEIDRQIVERQKLLEQGRPQPGGEGGFDREAMREMFEKRREVDEKIAEVSTRYADSIERALPLENREAFRFEINRSSLGGMMRRGSIVERLETAIASDAIDDAQRAQLREIEADMHKQYNALAKEMADQRQQARDQRGQEGGRGRDRQRGGDNGGNDLRQRMQDIEDELSTRMRAVLGSGDV
ncbi:MAG: hypothetical protein ACF8MJ_12315 [Phycisphaerales bacterium JB050]